MAKKIRNKKEQVCRAAVEVIAKEGFHEATIDQIAAAAGVAVGTIYNYFQSKNDLLDFIFQKEYEKRRSFFQEIQKKDLHPLQKLKQILSLHFAEVQENPDVFRVLLQEKCRPALSRFAGLTKFEGLPRFTAEIIAQGIAEGELKPCDPEIVSAAVFGIMEALLGSYLREVEAKGRSDILDNAPEEIVQIFGNGLNRI